MSGLTQEESEALATQRMRAAGGEAGVENDDYVQARLAFLRRSMTRKDLLANPELKALGLSSADYVTNDMGQLLFNNGVMVDPETRSVMFPSQKSGIDPADVPGSPQWLVKIQREWDEKKITKWRKTLAQQGYEVGEEGGMAYDLIEGLKNYHRARYLNFGLVQPAFPKSEAMGRGREIREAIDPVALKEEVKAWGEIPFGEELNENVADFFGDMVIDLAARLAKENESWTPEQALAGAELRAQKRFLKEPGVRQSIREAEEDEMDESLRNSIVSLAQLGNI